MKLNYIIPIALLCSVLLLSFEVEQAFALSVTTYDNNGDEAHSIIECGGKIITTDLTTLDIHFYTASSPSTHLGEITSGGGFYMGCSVGGRAFTYTSGGTLQEIDVANQALLRSLATGCDTSAMFVNIGVSTTMVCGTATASDTVKIINLAAMSITYTSSTLDTGVNNCDNIGGLWYNTSTDTLFATCGGNDRLVAVIGFSTSGTPDFSIASVSTTPTALAFNNINSNVFQCDIGAFAGFFDYSASTGFTASTTFANGQCLSNQAVDFRPEQGWFVVLDGDGQLIMYDAQAKEVILPIGLGNIGASYGFHFFSRTSIPIGIGTATDFLVVDATGVEFGEGATGEEGSETGGIDCTLPENENILICRLGGDGSLVGAGNFIVGNVNGTTGLTPIICATGIVDCVANPDMKTNGVGYLLVTIALAIIIGILWVASRGDLNSIPTFIWFIATLAVVGAFTLMDLIDATFLVITAIIVVALAAAKVRGLFGGEFR